MVGCEGKHVPPATQPLQLCAVLTKSAARQSAACAHEIQTAEGIGKCTRWQPSFSTSPKLAGLGSRPPSEIQKTSKILANIAYLPAAGDTSRYSPACNKSPPSSLWFTEFVLQLSPSTTETATRLLGQFVGNFGFFSFYHPPYFWRFIFKRQKEANPVTSKAFQKHCFLYLILNLRKDTGSTRHQVYARRVDPSVLHHTDNQV